MTEFKRDLQYWKFSLYGFVKNLQFFDPFLILFFREMGISFFQIGVLYSVREIITNITEIPTGIIADTLGRRSAMLFAFGFYIVSFALFYLFPSYWVYIGAMVFFALGESFRSGTHKAMIMEYLNIHNMADKKVAYYGNTRAWSQRGSAISAIIAALLVFFSGSYRSVFLWSIVPYLAGMALIASYPRELDFSCDEEECSEEQREKGWKDVVATVKNFIGLFTEPKIRRALINSSLFDGVFKTVKDYVQPILKNLALALPFFTALEGNKRVAIMSGVIYTILYLLTSVASSRASRFHSLFPNRIAGLNVTYISGVLAILGIAVFLNAGIPALAVTLFVIYYLLENLRRPATLGFVSDRIKGSVMATGLSGESQLKTLMVAAFSPLFGLIADRFGLGPAMLLIALIPALVYPLVRFRSED
ncbi:MFS transporter [Marispirochaeta sp.]|jgi:MFS family permease|uniref:MFS transporter n=1 Tax=Marispirochaeta sp. TaxID=2038653 RepID=UPI0029C6DA24|nr:MFS transporter [Marispirochaeta sp.]